MSDEIYNDCLILDSFEENSNSFTNVSIPEIPSKIITKKTKGPSLKKKNKKIHDNNFDDNLLRKIRIHFLNFIIFFLNDIFKALNIEKKLLKIGHNMKKSVTKKEIEFLKDANLKEIMKYKISPKYKRVLSDNNYIIVEELLQNKKEKELLEKIFSIKCLVLFKKVYYKSYKIINLKELEISEEDKILTLSNNVKMFKDLLKKMKDWEKFI